MGAAVRLRSDYSGDDLRRLARASRDAAQTRRLLSLAAIYDGGSRTMAARTGGVGLQIVRDWVLRFNARGPDGLLNRKAPGKTPLLSKAQRAALARAVEAGPKPYLDGVVRWRLLDLVQWLRENSGVSVSRQTLGRELRAMGYAKLSARPRHYAQNAEAVEAFKKTSPPNWRQSSKGSVQASRSRSGSRTRPVSGRRTN
jgi:transposase